MAMKASRNISTPPTRGSTIGIIGTMASTASWGWDSSPWLWRGSGVDMASSGIRVRIADFTGCRRGRPSQQCVGGAGATGALAVPGAPDVDLAEGQRLAGAHHPGLHQRVLAGQRPQEAGVHLHGRAGPEAVQL